MSLTTQPNHRMFAWALHLAGVATTVLAIGIFYAAVYRPLDSQQIEHQVRINQLDSLLLQSGSEAREYRNLRDQLAATKASVVEIRQLLGRPAEEAECLSDLGKIAAEVQLEVIDHQIGPRESLPTHSLAEIELRCHGSYASICQFLEQAEHLTKTTKLSKFELGATENFGRYPIQMTFVLYSEAKSHDTKEMRGVL